MAPAAALPPPARHGVRCRAAPPSAPPPGGSPTGVPPRPALMLSGGAVASWTCFSAVAWRVCCEARLSREMAPFGRANECLQAPRGITHTHVFESLHAVLETLGRTRCGTRTDSSPPRQSEACRRRTPFATRCRAISSLPPPGQVMRTAASAPQAMLRVRLGLVQPIANHTCIPAHQVLGRPPAAHDMLRGTSQDACRRGAGTPQPP